MQSQNKCGLWAQSSKCLVSMNGSKCCARRSGWCTTAISKGECILITAPGLRKRNEGHPCDILVIAIQFQIAWQLSELTFHHFKGLYQRAFLLLSFLICWDLINSVGFDFIHRFEKQMLSLKCPNLSIFETLIWRVYMSWVKQSNKSWMQCYLFQLSSGNAPQVPNLGFL